MAFILGMDTGGTYTDGVVIDSAGRNIICKAKALTTREDLDRDEIRNALLQMKGRVAKERPIETIFRDPRPA